jgi:hypothetical protein
LTTLQQRRLEQGLSGYDFAAACSRVGPPGSSAHPVTGLTANRALFYRRMFGKFQCGLLGSAPGIATSCSPPYNTATLLTLMHGDGGSAHLLVGRHQFLVQTVHPQPVVGAVSLLAVSTGLREQVSNALLSLRRADFILFVHVIRMAHLIIHQLSKYLTNGQAIATLLAMASYSRNPISSNLRVSPSRHSPSHATRIILFHSCSPRGEINRR